jgi:hypothetical protein
MAESINAAVLAPTINLIVLHHGTISTGGIMVDCMYAGPAVFDA